MAAEPLSRFLPDPEFAQIFSGVTSRNRELVERLVVSVIVSTADLLTEIEGAIWLPVTASVDEWSRDDVPLQHGGPLRVIHVPSNPMIKGSKLIEPPLL